VFCELKAFLGPDDASAFFERNSPPIDVSLQIVELGWNRGAGAGERFFLQIIAGAFQAGTAKKIRARNKAQKSTPRNKVAIWRRPTVRVESR